MVSGPRTTFVGDEFGRTTWYKEANTDIWTRAFEIPESTLLVLAGTEVIV